MFRNNINSKSMTLGVMLLTLAGCGDLFKVRQVPVTKQEIGSTCEYSLQCYPSMKTLATMGSRKSVLKDCIRARQNLLGRKVPETCLQDMDNKKECDQGVKVPASCNESLDLNDD